MCAADAGVESFSRPRRPLDDDLDDLVAAR
jgi:hypothetical protein